MYSICSKYERKENENYTKDKKKRSNNITCIMLLLAAIAIQMALGENGLIVKASKAKKESQQAETKERLQTMVLRNY